MRKTLMAGLISLFLVSPAVAETPSTAKDSITSLMLIGDLVSCQAHIQHMIGNMEIHTALQQMRGDQPNEMVTQKLNDDFHYLEREVLPIVRRKAVESGISPQVLRHMEVDMMVMRLRHLQNRLSESTDVLNTIATGFRAIRGCVSSARSVVELYFPTEQGQTK